MFNNCAIVINIVNFHNFKSSPCCGIAHNPKPNFVYMTKMSQHRKVHGQLNDNMFNDKGISERRE